MLNLLKNLCKSVLTTLTYCWSSVANTLYYTRVIPVIAVVFLANEEILMFANFLWDYLVSNSFCPWIMIFRGRASSVIIIEVVTYATNVISAPSLQSALSSMYGVASAVVELVGGPALGITLTAIFVFIAYKCMSLIFSKLFNRK